MPEFTFRPDMPVSQGPGSPGRILEWVRAVCFLSVILAIALGPLASLGQTRPDASHGAGTGQTSAAAHPAPYSIAWHYGEKPPLERLRVFTNVVVEPDHGSDPVAYRKRNKGQSELFAYLSIGEVQKTRPYFKLMPPAMLRGANEAWSSLVIDQSHPDWPEFFVTQIVAPLWAKGYRGFFLDTMDSYQLIAKDDASRQAQTRGLVSAIQMLKQRFPQARLVLNRGFELLSELQPLVEAVAAESLFRSWDQANQLYKAVPADDRQWLLDRLKEVKAAGLHAIAIDYVDPKDVALARQTANKIIDLGLTPYVTDGLLKTVGRGHWELLPRKVLLIHDTTVVGDGHYSDAQRFMVMPLQYLGYRVDLLDPRTEPLPTGFLGDEYAAAVLLVTSSDTLKAFNLGAFTQRALEQNLKLVFLDGLGLILDGQLANTMGLAPVRQRLQFPFSLAATEKPVTPFEVHAVARHPASTPFRLRGAGEVLLSVKDARSITFDVMGITPWGGWAQYENVFSILRNGEVNRWGIDPIAFFEKALHGSNFPIPDVTTESGRRMLMVHIDGDGFASRAEIPKLPFAAEVMYKDFLQRYKLPHTVSVIEGEVSANGMYPKLSGELENLARQIFALDHVEIASHSFSHPFNWSQAVAEVDNANVRLPIPGYRFNLQREIGGSAKYINERLAPAHKKTKIMLWTGDCVPPAGVIAETYAQGLYNMNGGDTLITRFQTSLSFIAPMSIRKKGWLQVYAPMQNENVYTNNWTGPFYGYSRLIETLELTEKPRRIKPMNIYYHTYSASKPAAIDALHKVYQYAMSKPHTPVYASQYIEKVLDWEDIAIARDIRNSTVPDSAQTWLLVGDDALHSYRMHGTARIDLKNSEQLAGTVAFEDQQFLNVTGPRALIRMLPPVKLASLGTHPQQGPGTLGGEPLAHVLDANGRIDDFNRTDDGISFRLQVHGEALLRLSLPKPCKVLVDGEAVQALPATSKQEPGSHAYRFRPQPSARLVSVRC